MNSLAILGGLAFICMSVIIQLQMSSSCCLGPHTRLSPIQAGGSFTAHFLPSLSLCPAPGQALSIRNPHYSVPLLRQPLPHSTRILQAELLLPSYPRLQPELSH